MAIQTGSVTAEELLRKPSSGFRYELVKGELQEIASAGSEHGYVAYRMALLLGQHVEANSLGRVYAAETGFKISSNPDTVRARRGTEDATVDSGDVVPGWRLPVAELF